jgi:hypothetical protein
LDSKEERREAQEESRTQVYGSSAEQFGCHFRTVRPMGQVQPSGAAQTKFVICNQTIEAGFKDLKRGGWGWHHSKMQDASRVERLWLAMAVAMVWTVRLGSQADSQLITGNSEQAPPGILPASA